LHCPGRELLPLKLLGIASSLLGFGRLAMHDNLPGSLCHATQASAWVTQKGVLCLTGLFTHAVMATLGFCRALLGDLWASVPFCQASLLRAVRWFLKTYLRVGRTRTSVLFHLVTSGYPHPWFIFYFVCLCIADKTVLW
jgi:hypothetical protein